jgi:hypothetical protein
MSQKISDNVESSLFLSRSPRQRTALIRESRCLYNGGSFRDIINNQAMSGVYVRSGFISIVLSLFLLLLEISSTSAAKNAIIIVPPMMTWNFVK